MERKRENPKLMPYIEKFLIEKLENCELFVNEYGKGFVKTRLYENFKRLYTEETNPRYAGEYSLNGSGALTLYAKGTDGNMLTFEDIEEDPDLQATTLHEGIHAILNKTPEECQALGIRAGSGMHFIYNGVRDEIGRGANEGFTNWLCEKAGLNPKSYAKLTRIIKLMEQAIGEEKVIQFGRGDIENNIAPLLQLPAEECALLFGKADTIYDLEELSRDLLDVQVLLEDKIRYKDKPREEIPEYINENLRKLGQNTLYKKVSKDPQYLAFVTEQGLDPKLDETKQLFFTKMYDIYTERTNILVGEINTTMISVFFSKELEDILENKGECKVEDYQRFVKIFDLLNNHGKYTNGIIKNFKVKYDQLRFRFCTNALEDVKNSLLSDTLTPEKLETYQEFFWNGDFRDSIDFEETVSDMMLPEDSRAYYTLLHGLTNTKQLSKLFDYKIISLTSEKGSKRTLCLDTKGEHSFARFSRRTKTILASDELSEDDRIFDITLDGLQEMQEIVKSFLSLKEEIKSKSPGAKIDIIDDVIISTNEHDQVQCYIIEDNNIVPVETTELLPQYRRPKDQIRFDGVQRHIVKPEDLNLTNQENDVVLNNNKNIEKIEEKDSNSTALKTITKNPIKRFFENIRENFSKFKDTFFNNYKPSKESHPIEETKSLQSTSSSFEDRVSVNVSGKYDPTKSKQQLTTPTSRDDDYIK